MKVGCGKGKNGQRELHLTFGKGVTTSEKARRHNTTRKSSARCPMKTSLCWSRAQDEELRAKLSSIKRAVAAGQQLLLVVDKSKWDETKHTFSLSFDDDKQRKSWSVMRQRVWVGWWMRLTQNII